MAVARNSHLYSFFGVLLLNLLATKALKLNDLYVAISRRWGYGNGHGVALLNNSLSLLNALSLGLCRPYRRLNNAEHNPGDEEGDDDIECLRADEGVEYVAVLARDDILESCIHTNADKRK